MAENTANEKKDSEVTASTEKDAKVDGEKKMDPIRMPSAAIGEVASYMNEKIINLVGEIEYDERLRASGYTIPVGVTEYLNAKLHDYNLLRDALTSCFYYKRLDKDEVEEIKKAAAEDKKNAEDKKASK